MKASDHGEVKGRGRGAGVGFTDGDIKRRVAERVPVHAFIPSYYSFASCCFGRGVNSIGLT